MPLSQITSNSVSSQDFSFSSNVNVAGTVSSSNVSVTGTVFSSNVNVTGTVAMGSSFMRNKIINGDMRIDQRNNGAANTGPGVGGAFVVDRWFCNEDTDGVLTVQQVSDAPAGFTQSAKITVTTNDASLAAAQNSQFRQAIEGYNISDLGWGAAGAQPVTLSFWVKSSLTGTFGGSLRNATPNRSYIFQYTINSANTWEYKTIAIAGDTTGTWETTSGIGIYVTFDLGSGTDRNGTANQWQTGSLLRTSSNISVISTLNATWQITGVQLEAGSVATPFERRLYGQELALSQRYFYLYSSGSVDFQEVVSRFSTTQGTIILHLPVTMRAIPSVYLAGSSPYGRVVGYDSSFNNTSTTVTAISMGAVAANDVITLVLTHGSITAAAGLYGFSFDTLGFTSPIGLSAEL